MMLNLANMESSSGIKVPLFSYSEVESTMDVARSLAEEGKIGVVVAEKQNRGRGRRGRNWLSPEGGLYFTLIVRPEIPSKKAHLLSLASGVAVARAIKKEYDLSVTLKWPNDVLYGGRKVAGILLEMAPGEKVPKYALIGIGVNVNHPVSQFESSGVALCEILGRRLSRDELLRSILKELYNIFEDFSPEEVLSTWRTLSDTLGRKVRVASPEGLFIGMACGVDEEGALILKTEEGRKIRILAGDCLYLRKV